MLARAEHAQERERPHAPGPRELRQHREREPAEPGGLDEVAVARPDGVTVDPARLDPCAPPPLDGIVEPNDNRPLRHEALDEEAEEHAGGLAAGPPGVAEDAVVGREGAVRVAGDTERCGDGPDADREEGLGYEDEGALEDGLGEERSERYHDGSECGGQRHRGLRLVAESPVLRCLLPRYIKRPKSS